MPFDHAEFHHGFGGEFFQRCAGGKQVFVRFAFSVDQASGSALGVFVPQLVRDIFKACFYSRQNTTDTEEGRAKVCLERPDNIA